MGISSRQLNLWVWSSGLWSRLEVEFEGVVGIEMALKAMGLDEITYGECINRKWPITYLWGSSSSAEEKEKNRTWKRSRQRGKRNRDYRVMSVKRVSRRKQWSTLTYALERSRTLWKKMTIGFGNMKVTVTLMRGVLVEWQGEKPDREQESIWGGETMIIENYSKKFFCDVGKRNSWKKM